ncbi:hypothetical protein AMJ85_05895 [candidate division BRC1 bacterium SM23_51]|nr:MAG: hypothetical protein AMJ85_05895 [candidate division BRC1 bacterium SM23_51]
MRPMATIVLFSVASTALAAAGGASPLSPGTIFPKADGYRGIWYFNQPSNDEYNYKYSGGLGTYCAKHIPFVYYAKAVNKSFFVYGGSAAEDGRGLLAMVSYYDHNTGLVPRPTILMDKKTDDAHDNPTIMLDEKGYVWVFASAHGTARPAYIFRSCEPCSIDSFDLIQETNFSYPQAWHFEGRGFLFLHTKYRNGRRLHWMTSRDGVQWSEPRELAGIAEGHYQVSWPWKNKLGTAFNYHPEKRGVNWRTNLYYLETDDFGRTWRNVRGERLEVPLRSIENKALVHDYAAENLLVYLKDISYDSQGRPIILYVTSRSYRAGPGGGPRTWTTARWTGQNWEINGSIHSDNNYDMGSLYVESDDLWRIIAPTEPGPQRFNPGGEVATWISGDKGRAWTKIRQLTRGSAYNHTYVRRPVHAHGDFYGFWADGHGRQRSESRLYFTDRAGKHVRRLPVKMTKDFERPETLE